MNAIGLVIGKIEAEKQGVVTPDSTRIGVVAAMMPNPLMSLIVGRKMGEKEAPVGRAGTTDSGTGATLDNGTIALAAAQEAQTTANEAKTAADAAKVSADEAKAAAVRTEEAVGQLVKRFEVVEKKVDELSKPAGIAVPKK